MAVSVTRGLRSARAHLLASSSLPPSPPPPPPPPLLRTSHHLSPPLPSANTKRKLNFDLLPVQHFRSSHSPGRSNVAPSAGKFARKDTLGAPGGKRATLKDECAGRHRAKGKIRVVQADTEVKSQVEFESVSHQQSCGVGSKHQDQFPRPYPDECREVRDLLLAVHGRLEEYERHRSTPASIDPITICEPQARPVNARVEELQPIERDSVLGALVGTILSQNTTELNSSRAYSSLIATFQTWEAVQRANVQAVENAIKCGGLAFVKASRIHNMLTTLVHERGTLNLEYLRNLSSEAIKDELSRFKGVGPKTVACVLMFHLGRNDFPVDTHVYRIAKALGWIPECADREKAYLHLNEKIPDNLKFDLHYLLVTHGRQCPNCSKRKHLQDEAFGPCPLNGWKNKKSC